MASAVVDSCLLSHHRLYLVFSCVSYTALCGSGGLRGGAPQRIEAKAGRAAKCGSREILSCEEDARPSQEGNWVLSKDLSWGCYERSHESKEGL